MNKTKSLLTSIDAFSFKHEIKYNSQTRYKTAFGGCLTFLILVLVCFAIGFFGQELFVKEKPTVTQSTKPVSLEEIPLKSLGLSFFFSDPFGKIYNLDKSFHGCS